MTVVALEIIARWVVSGEEVENLDVLNGLACKQVATIGKNDLATRPNVQILVLLDRIGKDVHHSNLVIKAYNNLETSRMEGDTVSGFLEYLVNLELEVHGSAIAPNLYSHVGRAGGDQVLLNANVHACNGARVERVYQVLINSLYILIVK